MNTSSSAHLCLLAARPGPHHPPAIARRNRAASAHPTALAGSGCHARLETCATGLLLLLALLLLPARVSAAEVTVTTTSDSVGGSLRQLILTGTSPGDTIRFAANVRGTLNLTAGEIVINKNLTIWGPGPELLAISGNNASRVFRIADGVTVLIRDLSVDNGNGLPTILVAGQTAGGGVFNGSGTLTLSNCWVRYNVIRGGNVNPGLIGQSAYGGGIASMGTLSLLNCLVQGNQVYGGNGGIPVNGYGGEGGNAEGGGVYAQGSLTISRSSIHGNRCLGGEEGAPTHDDGGFALGAGVRHVSGEFAAANSTFARNQAVGDPGDAGALSVAGLYLSGNSTIRSCTIAENSATTGHSGDDDSNATGGIYAYNGPHILANSIIARNTALFGSDDNYPDMASGVFVSGGYNLIGDGSRVSASFTAPGDQVGGAGTASIDPKLQFIPAQVPYFLPKPGSPALDRGASASLTDQRGRPRTIDIPSVPNVAGGLGTDIGAVEVTFSEVLDFTDSTFVSGTMRAVLVSAGFGDIDHIYFANTTRKRIMLEQGDLVINKDIMLAGPGADLLTISGGHNSRVFNIVDATAYISGLTIADGYAPEGGGVRVSDAEVTLTDCVLWGNGVSAGGVITERGGALLNSHGIVTVERSAVLFNTGDQGAGLNNASEFADSMTVVNSTLAYNTGTALGYAGVALHNEADANVPTCAVINSTITGNIILGGGGASAVRAFDTIRIRNSVIAGNVWTLGSPADVSGSFISEGYNFIGSSLGSGGFGAFGDQFSLNVVPLNARLGALQYNLGPVPVIAPLPGSPLIDAAFEFPGNLLPYLIDGCHPDIGAFEVPNVDRLHRLVTNTNDSGPGSLRDALYCVLPGGVITFAANVTNRIALTNGELIVNKAVTILGPGAKTLAVSGNSQSRVFWTAAGGVMIADLTIRDGRPTYLNAPTDGGGVLNYGSLVLSNCLLTANVARGMDGAAPPFSNGESGRGGGVANFSSLTLIGCLLHDNRAEGGNGAVNGTAGAGLGGGIFNTGLVVVINTTLSTNRATGGAGGMGAVGMPGRNGGNAEGAGIHNQGVLRMVHGTVYDNTLTGGAAGLAGAGSTNGLPGTSLATGLRAAGGTNQLLNTAIRHNPFSPPAAPAAGFDVFGSVNSLGHNLISATNGSTGWVASDLVGSVAAPLDPVLGPLADNCAAIRTHALLAASPCLNAGDNASLAPPWNLTIDQRGFPRQGGAVVDIGAFETQTQIQVANTNDSGPGSLREALACLGSGGVITFAPEVTNTIVLTSGTLGINQGVTIQGPGAKRLTVSGNGASRVFVISSGVVTLADLTIADGSFTGGTAADARGGGIHNLNGNLTLSNCTVTGNSLRAAAAAAGIGATGITALGGGVYNGNRLTVINCAFYKNAVLGGTGSTGSPFDDGGTGGDGRGGAIYTAGFLNVFNSTFNTNRALGGAGGAGQIGNAAGGDGGNAAGGAIAAASSAFQPRLSHVTVVGNQAISGFGGVGDPPGGVNGANGLGLGGGVARTGGIGPALLNSLVALNSASTDGRDVSSTVASQGHNLIGITNGSSGWTATDLVGYLAGPIPVPRDPRLLPFADYGGPTFTFALCADSPALDAGDDALVTTTTDQRGLSRTNGAHVDIGAYEAQANDLPNVEVTTLADNSAGSLRDALGCVRPGGTITFAPNLGGTITLTSGELVVNKSVNILGPGPGRLHISGDNASRVFNVTAGTNLISGLTIRNGRPTLGSASQGGGLFNQAALTISNCVFTANRAVGLNGADGISGAPNGGPGTSAMAGAIYNAPGGSLTLAACSFSLNEAGGGNGGNGRSGGGGGHGGPAGSGSGGAVASDGPLTVLNCTFSTNRVFGGNGGTGGFGTFIDGNGGNGGSADSGAILNRNIANLVHLTVVANETTLGTGGSGEVPGTPGSARAGGIYSVGASTLLLNSLVASNRAVTAGPDVSGTFYSVGRNLISATNGSTGWQATDLTGSIAAPRDPGLGLFGLNFGSTPNYALQTSSPAVNAGDNLSLGNPWFLATDQRGFPRRASATVDIGAYELCRDLPAVEVTTLNDSVLGSLRAAIECIAPGGTITFAPGLSDPVLPGYPPGYLQLTGGELVIDKSLTIVGPGADRLSIQQTDGRIFRIVSGQVRLSGLTIRNGYARGADGAATLNPSEDGAAGADGEGGGILNFGNLTLTDFMVMNCWAFGGNGATGGVNFAILQPGTGGAGGAGRGGGLCNRGTLTLLRCTLANNTAIGGIGGTGGQDFNINAGNSGGLGGGGGYACGGGLYNAGLFSATNCTVVTNFVHAGDGGVGGSGIPGGGNGGNGGVGLGAGLCDEGAGVLVSSTLHANRGFAGSAGPAGAGSGFPGSSGMAGLAAGGGMFTDNVLPYTFVRNTLSAGNVSANGSDAIGVVISGGFNFIGLFNNGSISSLNFFTEPTDQVGIWPVTLDARIGPLGYFGGSTLVQSLLANSPAIDKGHASGTTADQRGVGRPADQPALANASGGDGSDIGAFEAEGPATLSVRIGVPMSGFNTVILSWPNPSTGYVLQQTANMSVPGGGWADVEQAPVVVGANRELTLPATGRFCLFRLRHP